MLVIGVRPSELCRDVVSAARADGVRFARRVFGSLWFDWGCQQRKRRPCVDRWRQQQPEIGLCDIAGSGDWKELETSTKCSIVP